MNLPSDLQLNSAACEKMSRMCSHIDSELQDMSRSAAPQVASAPSVSRENSASAGSDPLFSVYVPVDFSHKTCVQLPVEVADALRFLSYRAGRLATQRDILCNLVLSAARERGYVG